MLKVIQFVIALAFISKTFAAKGAIQIVGSRRSGKLQFYNGTYWGSVCKDGFDDDAGDVACRQLGYLRSSDVYVYEYFYDTNDTIVCYTKCDGDESRLNKCKLTLTSKNCRCTNGVVGITCTNSLTPGAVAGLMIGVLVFIASITTCIIVCICCLVPTCPCYYRSHHTTRTVVVTQPAVPQVVTTTATTSPKATKYQPPAYAPDTGYQPVPPIATTAKY